MYFFYFEIKQNLAYYLDHYLENLESRQVCKADIRIVKSSMQEKTSKKVLTLSIPKCREEKKVFHFVFRIGFGRLRQ